MLIDICSDNHVHTPLCQHAAGTMEDYVQAAITRGLSSITFLEHLEQDVNYAPRTWLTEADFDRYFDEGTRLKERYRDRIAVGLGVEVGYNPDAAERICERLSRRQWDLIGLSYHFCRIPGLPKHLNLLSRKRNNIRQLEAFGSSELLYRYLDALIEAIERIPAQMLCHLDAGLRYLPDLRFEAAHHTRVDRLLDGVKQRGMALEINTSGYDIRNEPFPRTDIILRARDRHIPLRASSDAHHPAEVGRHFDKLPGLLSAATR